jgi:hypothetical protein
MTPGRPDGRSRLAVADAGRYFWSEPLVERVCTVSEHLWRQ